MEPTEDLLGTAKTSGLHDTLYPIPDRFPQLLLAGSKNILSTQNLFLKTIKQRQVQVAVSVILFNNHNNLESVSHIT